MSDIEAAFEDGPAFVPYLAAGDPDADASRKHVEALAAGGADVIELGLPFSEPIAEGSTIQSAIVRSLEGGMTVDGYFEFVDSLDVDVPVVCMTYYNLIYQYGDSEPRGGSDSASSSSSEGRSPSGSRRKAPATPSRRYARGELPLDGRAVAYGDRRCRSRGNSTASRMLSSPSIVMTRRSPPRPQPAWGGIP